MEVNDNSTTVGPDAMGVGTQTRGNQSQRPTNSVIQQLLSTHAAPDTFLKVINPVGKSLLSAYRNSWLHPWHHANQALWSTPLIPALGRQSTRRS